jgi:hypothetical protein
LNSSKKGQDGGRESHARSGSQQFPQVVVELNWDIPSENVVQVVVTSVGADGDFDVNEEIRLV